MLTTGYSKISNLTTDDDSSLMPPKPLATHHQRHCFQLYIVLKGKTQALQIIKEHK